MHLALYLGALLCLLLPCCLFDTPHLLLQPCLLVLLELSNLSLDARRLQPHLLVGCLLQQCFLLLLPCKPHLVQLLLKLRLLLLLLRRHLRSLLLSELLHVACTLLFKPLFLFLHPLVVLLLQSGPLGAFVLLEAPPQLRHGCLVELPLLLQFSLLLPPLILACLHEFVELPLVVLLRLPRLLLQVALELLLFLVVPFLCCCDLFFMLSASFRYLLFKIRPCCSKFLLQAIVARLRLELLGTGHEVCHLPVEPFLCLGDLPLLLLAETLQLLFEVLLLLGNGAVRLLLQSTTLIIQPLLHCRVFLLHGFLLALLLLLQTGQLLFVLFFHLLRVGPGLLPKPFDHLLVLCCKPLDLLLVIDVHLLRHRLQGLLFLLAELLLQLLLFLVDLLRQPPHLLFLLLLQVAAEGLELLLLLLLQLSDSLAPFLGEALQAFLLLLLQGVAAALEALVSLALPFLELLLHFLLVLPFCLTVLPLHLALPFRLLRCDASLRFIALPVGVHLHVLQVLLQLHLNALFLLLQGTLLIFCHALMLLPQFREVPLYRVFDVFLQGPVLLLQLLPQLRLLLLELLLDLLQLLLFRLPHQLAPT
eukprot:Sspe_Gene.45258::Locus_22359_Transcript_1_1_Confidence_1.000_Length_3426::g.45258::m.45258